MEIDDPDGDITVGLPGACTGDVVCLVSNVSASSADHNLATGVYPLFVPRHLPC